MGHDTYIRSSFASFFAVVAFFSLAPSCNKMTLPALSQTLGNPESKTLVIMTCPSQTALSLSTQNSLTYFACSQKNNHDLTFFGSIEYHNAHAKIKSAPIDALSAAIICADNEKAAARIAPGLTHATVEINCLKNDGTFNSDLTVKFTVPSVRNCSKSLEKAPPNRMTVICRLHAYPN